MKAFTFVLSFLLSITVFGQSSNKNPSNSRLDSIFIENGLTEICTEIKNNGWVKFDKNKNIDPATIFEKYGQLFGLKRENSMKLIELKTDDDGMSHYYYKQVCDGHELDGIEYIIHASNNAALSGNGKMVPLLEGRKFSKKVNISDAYLSALKQITPHAPLSEFDLNKVAKKQYKTVFVPMTNTDPTNERNYTLSYQFDIPTYDRDSVNNVYFDIENNRVLKRAKLTRNIDGLYDFQRKDINVETLFNSYQTVNIMSYASFWPWNRKYELSYNHTGANANYQISTFWNSGISVDLFYKDCLGCWGESTTEKAGLSALWAAERLYLYFKNNHNVHGIDGNNGLLKLIVNHNFGHPNASYNPATKTINFGSSISGICHDMVSLDIVGHEYTHGICYHVKRMTVYEGEVAAVEEGFCDIFGKIIQYNVEGYNRSNLYLYGQNVIVSGNEHMRSFENPKQYGQHVVNDWNCNNYAPGQPTTYNGEHWYFGPCNEGSAHGNNTVLTHCFFLLAEGKQGTNDNNEAYNVQGIGFHAAARIFTHAFFNYVEPRSTFMDVRNATIQAAKEQYGEASNEYRQVFNAWAAVGVGINSFIIGPSIVCPGSSATYTVNNLPANATLSWSQNNNFTFTEASGNIATFTSVGTGAGQIKATINGIEFTKTTIVGVPPVQGFSGIFNIPPPNFAFGTVSRINLGMCSK